MPQVNGIPRAVRAIVITGLRRSGTTVLWETFRRDPRIVGYDEPFHPQLWGGVRTNSKGTLDELAAYWNSGRAARFDGVTPIRPVDELVSRSSGGQIGYLDDLLNQGERVVVDLVRCWNRFPTLLNGRNDVLVVHLVRNPATWVSAHLLPARPRLTARSILGSAYRRGTFFVRQRGYDNWSYEQIVDAALTGQHDMWRYVKRGGAQSEAAPAYIKLLAFWWAATQVAARGLSGMPVAYVAMEEFVARPRETMRRLYAQAGWDISDSSSDHVRPTRDRWLPASIRWAEAFEEVGIPCELLEKGSFTTKRLMSAVNVST